MSRPLAVAALFACGVLAGGCLNIKAPEKIEVNVPETRDDSTASDSPRNVPETHTQEEARAELRKAYARIEDLEKDNRKLRSKINTLEVKIDKLEKERKDDRKAAKRDKKRDDAAERDQSRREEVP